MARIYVQNKTVEELLAELEEYQEAPDPLDPKFDPVDRRPLDPDYVPPQLASANDLEDPPEAPEMFPVQKTKNPKK